MLVDEFVYMCRPGDESEAKSMVQRFCGLPNIRDRYGNTGLMLALSYKRHFICRWLLSLPGLDINTCNAIALHGTCEYIIINKNLFIAYRT